MEELPIVTSMETVQLPFIRSKERTLPNCPSEYTKNVADTAQQISKQFLSQLSSVQGLIPTSLEDFTFKVKIPGKKTVSRETILETARTTLEMTQNISLYHHIPVCPSKCTFCHYPSITDVTKLDEWINLTLQESGLFLSQQPELKDVDVTSLYIGGGTPSLMEPEQFQRIMAHYTKEFRFSNHIEISFEARPETLTSEKVDALRQGGVNRLSVGIQTLDDTLLKFFKRSHKADNGLEAVKMALDRGIETVNADLIYGLPGQRVETFASDVGRVVAAAPTSVTLYRLRIVGHDAEKTPLNKKYKNDPKSFPSREDVYAMQIAGRMILNEAGYKEGPAGWFHRDGTKSRVYEDRWYDQVPLFGFGWNAYSYGSTYAYNNHHSKADYINAVKAGQLPFDTGTLYQTEEQIRRFFVFRLKHSLRIGRSDLDARFMRQSWETVVDQLLPICSSNSLISIDENSYIVSEKGTVFIEDLIDRIFL